jgi:hypothetical protein
LEYSYLFLTFAAATLLRLRLEESLGNINAVWVILSDFGVGGLNRAVELRAADAPSKRKLFYEVCFYYFRACDYFFTRDIRGETLGKIFFYFFFALIEFLS